MYSREEFENLRRQSAQDMAADHKLQEDAIDLLERADQHRWIHQTTWFGEPVLNLPQDLFAIQEIIFKTRPKFVIEVGVAWGGGLLFYSTLMEALGGERVIGIDIYVPPDLKERIGAHGRLSDRISWINNSSIEESTLEEVESILKGSRDVLVILDSNHTHEHVLQELRLFSTLVGKGHYIVCGDTVVEFIPPQEHRPRPWGPGNNPKTALDEFLQENDRFEIDRELDSKLLFSCNPGGFLRCSKD